jgi:hypothetical protein
MRDAQSGEGSHQRHKHEDNAIIRKITQSLQFLGGLRLTPVQLGYVGLTEIRLDRSRA